MSEFSERTQMDNDLLQETEYVSSLKYSGSKSKILIRLSERYLLIFEILINFKNVSNLEKITFSY